jgi:transcriptional regulator with XRE-family HTH domain
MADWVKTSSTSLRLQEIMDKKQLKQADLARMTGISRGAVSNYVLGRYEPKSDVISKFAKSLNCSEMWLWGYDVPMERIIDKATNTIEVTEDEQKLLDLFRLVPENQQQMVLQMIEIALNTNK